MKKFLILIICVLSIFTINVYAGDTVSNESEPVLTLDIHEDKKVTIYVFRGSGCSHCLDALTYLGKNMYKYSDKIDVAIYEVWYDQNNNLLVDKIAQTLGIEIDGVPFILVGDSFHISGFGINSGQELIQAALQEYENENYKDIVKPLLSGEETSQNLTEACAIEGCKVSTGKSDALPIILIFAFVGGAIAAGIYFGRKQK